MSGRVLRVRNTHTYFLDADYAILRYHHAINQHFLRLLEAVCFDSSTTRKSFKWLLNISAFECVINRKITDNQVTDGNKLLKFFLCDETKWYLCVPHAPIMKNINFVCMVYVWVSCRCQTQITSRKSAN